MRLASLCVLGTQSFKGGLERSEGHVEPVFFEGLDDGCVSYPGCERRFDIAEDLAQLGGFRSAFSCGKVAEGFGDSFSVHRRCLAI